MALIAFGMTEWAAYIALIVYAFAEGGTARVGLVSTITLVVAAVVAPLGSVLGDRYRRERVLILAHAGLALGTGATAIAMLAGLSPVLVYAAATISAALLTLVRPMHNVLPGPALERVARNAVPVHVEAGATVIREGGAGDRYYVVAAGSVEVTRGGAPIARLGPATSSGRSRCSGMCRVPRPWWRFPTPVCSRSTATNSWPR